MKDFTPPFLGLTAAVPFARCIVAGTRIPSTRLFGSTDIDEHHPRSILNPPPMGTPLQSIPTEVAGFLFNNYLTRIAAQYPIFYTPDVIAFYNSVYSPRDGMDVGVEATQYASCVVSLIMAISLSTAARTQQARANAIAAGLFRTAIQQMSAVLSNSVEGLQVLLLLLQYTFLDPGAANIWFLSGFTSQACIDLGLHEESLDVSLLTPLMRDMRRRVFWCAYEMEVAVSAGLLRPTSLLSKHINVPFPTDIEDSAISATGVDITGRSSKFTSRRIWLFRQIESEIVSVLFQNQEIPHGHTSIESWMANTDAAITQWYEEVHSSASANTDPTMNSQWNEMVLYADIAYPYILVTLYRPCPRIRDPSPENLMKAFSAGVKVADGYWRQANVGFGSSKYVFHPCHHTFSSAVAFLQALQRCKETISNTYTLKEVEDYMSCFSRLFATMAERWPAASRCLEEYERLLAPVKKEYIDFIVKQAQSVPVQPPNFDNLVGFQDELNGSELELDDMFNFGSFFRPAGPATFEERTWLYDAVPINWNAEFDFGMY